MNSVEYKEVIVPLGIDASAEAGSVDKAGAARQAAINAGSLANAKILEMLRQEGAQGWQADESTDLFSLLVAGRVKWRQTGGIFFTWKFRFDSATIRLKRTR